MAKRQKFRYYGERSTLLAMRACALRWRLRSRQVTEGKEWARLEAGDTLLSAIWYRKKVNWEIKTYDNTKANSGIG